MKFQIFRTHNQSLLHSSGEAWFLREFNNHLSNQNLLFFDVGANIGLWTSEAVNYLNSSSTVHCFEPLSLNYNILSKRFQKDSRIKLNNLGLSKENLESKIYTVARDSGMSSLYQRKLEHFMVKYTLQYNKNEKKLAKMSSKNKLNDV